MNEIERSAVEELMHGWNSAVQEGSQKNNPAGIPINHYQSLTQAINNAILGAQICQRPIWVHKCLTGGYSLLYEKDNSLELVVIVSTIPGDVIVSFMEPEVFNRYNFERNVFKWVCENHVDSDEHWKNRPMIKNDLTSEVIYGQQE